MPAEKGIAGVIIDGTSRDKSDILALHFPVYSRGYCPAGTTKKVPAIFPESFVCGGVSVKKGDLIFADEDGVVVIPGEVEDEVIEKALAKYEHEKEILKKIESGKDTLEIYGFAF